jgi:hypothetical protein
MPRDLDAGLEELRAREPLFHHRELVHSADTFDLEVADDFWEVGASGRVYDRDTVKKNVLRRLANTAVDEMVVENWRTADHQLRELGPNTYLLTYVLHGQSRVTRRATIWRHDPDRGWHALYHQGTVVATD